MEIKPRDLQEKDFWRLLKIVNKASSDVRSALKESVGSATDAAGVEHVLINQQGLMEAVLGAMVDQEDEIKGFLSDLMRIKPEAFDELPFGAALDVIVAVLEQDAVPDFLGKLFGLVNRDWSRLASASRPASAGATPSSSASRLTALPTSSPPSKSRRKTSSAAS